jgi:hypothetical protein
MSNLAKLAATMGMKFGPVRKGLTPRKILEHVLNDMVMVQADHKMATDPNAICRYDGMMEAYRGVAHFIAPSTDIPVKAVRASVRTRR